jgi:serine/threonine protein kinase
MTPASSALSELSTLELGVQKVLKVRFARVQVEETLVGGDYKFYTGHFYPHKSLQNVLGDKPYHAALKCIQPVEENNFLLLQKRALMLARETKILSQVQHENIRHLHAISKRSLSQALLQNKGLGYFIVLEVIPETLRERMEVWRREQRIAASSSFLRLLPWHQPTIDWTDAVDRIQKVAIGVAKAMAYLHQHKIIFGAIHNRDRIGFDQKGVVKLIDMSTCQEVASSPSENNSVQQQGGGCYSYASDLSLYGFLLYELVTLQTPKTTTTLQGTTTTTKPPLSLSMIPSESIKSLIQYCWSSNRISTLEDDPRDHRPTFTRLVKRLLEATSGSKRLLEVASEHRTSPEATTTATTSSSPPLKKPSTMIMRSLLQRQKSLTSFLSKSRPAVIDDLDRGRHHPVSLEVEMESKNTPASLSTTNTTTEVPMAITEQPIAITKQPRIPFSFHKSRPVVVDDLDKGRRRPVSLTLKTPDLPAVPVAPKSPRQKLALRFSFRKSRQVVEELDRGRHNCHFSLEDLDMSYGTDPETVLGTTTEVAALLRVQE